MVPTEMKPDTRVLEFNIEVSVDDVLRLLHCPDDKVIREEAQTLVDCLLTEAESVLQPRGIYTVRPVDRMTDTELTLDGCPTIHGPIAAFLKPATRVAVFVVTVGDAITRLADERLAAGRKLEGRTLSAIGSVAVDAAADAMAETIFWNEASAEEAVTAPFSPGYCGLPLDEQETLLSIVDASVIGVTLLPSMVMEPAKSISGLFGIGDGAAVLEHGVPCQWCNVRECKSRGRGRT
ncbi:MAG: hypothetical protein JXA69_01425 [Phycisphaerae bacterium]|nr:hypothetical protein [Phycisphaerae bacterium]